MLEMTRRAAAVLPRLPLEALAAVGTTSAFGWLLANDLVAPIAVYLLELFLAF